MENIKVPGLRCCCFCIPLRGGVLAFNYISVIYHVVFILPSLYFAGIILAFYGVDGVHESDHMWFITLPLLVGLITYNVLVIAATHLNNVRGLRNNIIFGAVLLAITIAMSIYLIYVDMKYTSDRFRWEVAIFILEPLLQLYGLLLIHSLKLKLGEERKYEYTNVAGNKPVEAGTYEP